MADGRVRHGFALITVLWVLSTIGVVALGAAALGRDEFNASANRIALERAWWQAEGCAAEIRSVIGDSLAPLADVPGAQDHLWRAMDRVIANVSLDDSTCVVASEPTGNRLDVNAATDEELDRLFDALGVTGDASRLRDALHDWIDADSEPRPNGAEADWYRAQQRRLPRNGPLADAREITRIRGFEDLSSIEPFISIEDPRICVATAPAIVLAAIPAFSPAIVDHILDMRAAGEPINDLSVVLDGVPESDADSAIARFPEIQQLTTLDPDAWILTVRAAIRPGAPVVSVEQRLVRNGSRAVVVRTRVSP